MVIKLFIEFQKINDLRDEKWSSEKNRSENLLI
jgi:hypothetical protein